MKYHGNCFFSLSRLLLVLFGASGHFVEFWVFLVVAETVASPLFCGFLGIVQCLFNLLYSSFGDFTRPQHQEITNNFKSVKNNRNSRTSVHGHAYFQKAYNYVYSML